MKKLIAVILAVLLLGSAVACAEGTRALELKDPVLELTQDGQTAVVDLAGLTLRVGALEEEEPTLVLNILGDDAVLFRAAVVIRDGAALFSADGLSHSYAVRAAGAGLAASSGEEGEDASALAAELLGKVLAEAETGLEGDAVTFRLPYTAVNELLGELLPTLKGIPNAGELASQFEAWAARGNGFELSGSLSTNGGVRAELAATPVSGGETAGEAAFVLRFELTPAELGVDFVLTLSVPSAGDAPVFLLTGSILSGEGGFEAHVAASLPATGSEKDVATLDLGVGENISLVCTLTDALRLEAGFDRETSTALLDFDARSRRLTLRAEAARTDAQPESCPLPAEVLELSALSDEEKDALGEELRAALNPVLAFAAPALQASGLLG